MVSINDILINEGHAYHYEGGKPYKGWQHLVLTGQTINNKTLDSALLLVANINVILGKHADLQK